MLLCVCADGADGGGDGGGRVGANALHFFELLHFFPLSPFLNVFKMGTFLPVRCLCLTLASFHLKMIYRGTGTHAMLETRRREGERGREERESEREMEGETGMGVALGTEVSLWAPAFFHHLPGCMRGHPGSRVAGAAVFFPSLRGSQGNWGPGLDLMGFADVCCWRHTRAEPPVAPAHTETVDINIGKKRPLEPCPPKRNGSEGFQALLT